MAGHKDALSCLMQLMTIMDQFIVQFLRVNEKACEQK